MKDRISPSGPQTSISQAFTAPVGEIDALTYKDITVRHSAFISESEDRQVRADYWRPPNGQLTICGAYYSDHEVGEITILVYNGTASSDDFGDGHFFVTVGPIVVDPTVILP
jgi:hypothetical protein